MAIERFDSIKIRKDKQGRRYLEGVLYPTIPEEATDKYVRTKYGDRLDNLAYKYYGNTQYWWILSLANPSTINGSYNIKAGTRLRIPQNFSDIVAKFRNLNRRG